MKSLSLISALFLLFIGIALAGQAAYFEYSTSYSTPTSSISNSNTNTETKSCQYSCMYKEDAAKQGCFLIEGYACKETTYCYKCPEAAVTTTTTTCPQISKPTEEEIKKCSASGGSYVSGSDEKGCTTSYKCTAFSSQPTTTTTSCPAATKPSEEEYNKCIMNGGTEVSYYDDNKCLKGYQCVISTTSQSTTVTCPQPEKPTEELYEKCSEIGGSVVAAYDENKCVKGYQCAQPTATTTTTTITNAQQCPTDESLLKELNNLLVTLDAAESKGDTTTASELKVKIESVKNEITTKQRECLAAQTTAISITTPTPVTTTTVATTTTSCPEVLPSREEYIRCINKQGSFIPQYDEKKCVTSYSCGSSGESGGVVLSVYYLCPELAEMAKEMESLLESEKQAKAKNDNELATSIRSKIDDINNRVNKTLEDCGLSMYVSSFATAAPTVMKVGTTQARADIVCSIPEYLQNDLNNGWSMYKEALESNDTEKVISAKKLIAASEDEINLIKSQCQPTATSTTTVTPTEVKNTTPLQQTVYTKAEGCSVPVELTQEFEGQWKNYNTAIANNDTQKAAEIKAKISEIEQKISSTKGQCVKTVVSQAAEAKDIASYYKEKMTEVMTTNASIDDQITSLKSLRAEIDKVITDLIKKKSEFNASDVGSMITNIKVKKNEIIAGTSTIENATTTIVTKVNDKEVKVKPTATGVTITEGNLNVQTWEVTIEENKLKISDTTVNVVPSDVQTTAKMKVDTMSLAMENNKAVYTASGTADKKLFWIIPVKMGKEVKVDAESGAVVSEQKPWWSFLAGD